MIGVDDGVRFDWKTIDSTNLIEIVVPLFGMFYYDTEIDISILGFDSAGKFFTIGGV